MIKDIVAANVIQYSYYRKKVQRVVVNEVALSIIFWSKRKPTVHPRSPLSNTENNTA
jgi:hypothetical protein